MRACIFKKEVAAASAPQKTIETPPTKSTLSLEPASHSGAHTSVPSVAAKTPPCPQHPVAQGGKKGSSRDSPTKTVRPTSRRKLLLFLDPPTETTTLLPSSMKRPKTKNESPISQAIPESSRPIKSAPTADDDALADVGSDTEDPLLHDDD